MNIKLTGAFAGFAAVFAASAALASPMPTQGGHYEWRGVTQAPGPRAPIVAPRRVWIADPMTRGGAVAGEPNTAGVRTACAMPCAMQRAS